MFSTSPANLLSPIIAIGPMTEPFKVARKAPLPFQSLNEIQPQQPIS
jgi:hypothetical protein